jgi:hypothetical protein
MSKICPQLKQNLETIKTLKSELDFELSKLQELFKIFKNNNPSTSLRVFDNKLKAEFKKERTGLINKIKSLKAEINFNINIISEKMMSELEKELNLKEQYNSQIKILINTGLIEKLSNGQYGLIGIDNKEYNIPSYKEIVNKVKAKAELLKLKKEQGFTKLIITPFGQPLSSLIEKYRKVILAHHKSDALLATNGSKLDLNTANPIYVRGNYPNSDINGNLKYYPKQFDKNNHGGQTKQEILNQTKSGFNIIFIEDMPDLPKENADITIGNRKKLKANKAPIDYLDSIQADPQHEDESGLTTEDWLTYAVTQLEEKNQVIDDGLGQGQACWNVGAYYDSDNVLYVYYDRIDHRVCLVLDVPGDRVSNVGVRLEVRL